MGRRVLGNMNSVDRNQHLSGDWQFLTLNVYHTRCSSYDHFISLCILKICCLCFVVCYRYIPDDCESYGRTDDDASALVTDDGESYVGTNDGSRAQTDDEDSELYDNHPKVTKSFFFFSM